MRCWPMPAGFDLRSFFLVAGDAWTESVLPFVLVPTARLGKRIRRTTRGAQDDAAELNQTLQVPAQGPVGKRTPDVFENFMRVKKVGAVEQIETFVEFLVAWQSGHSGLARTVHSTLPDNLHVSID